MPKPIPSVPFPALCAALALFPAAAAPARPAAYYHWEKIRVSHATATQVFARLGLTHITRLGFTRGSAKTDPDPHFPPGLTDVVPDDADHALIVRGTDNGILRFRPRVVAADTAAQTWRLTVTLLRARDGREETVATQDRDAVPTDALVETDFGDGPDRRAYQLRVRVGVQGNMAVTCQSRVALPAPPAAGGDAHAQDAPPPAVYVPALAWTEPVSRPVAAGGTVTFDDRGPSPVPPAAYRLRITITPDSAPPAPDNGGAGGSPGTSSSPLPSEGEGPGVRGTGDAPRL